MNGFRQDHERHTSRAVELSVLLPAWNEGENIVELARRLLAYPEVRELIVVDDESADGTPERWAASGLSADPRTVFVRNPRRLGLACSILQAWRLASREFVVIRDSDWNHDVEDIPALARAAALGSDFVVASRYSKGAPPLGRANDLLSLFLNRLLSFRHRKITDWTYGYFLARRDLLASAPCGWIFRGRGEYSLRLFRWVLGRKPGFPMAEIPTRVRPRGGGKSSTRPIRHGLAYLAAMRERMPQPSSFESDFSRALFRWKKAGSSPAACGHSRLGWRSRGALLAKEMAGVRGEVLDLACGNGAFGAKAAWGRDLLLYGVDRDAELLEGARGRGYRELVRGDLRDGLPAELARRRYDAFFCFELLQYLDGPEMFRLFEESKSVAGGEAHFLCILPNRASYWHRARRWAGLGKEDYHRMHDLPQVVAAAQAAGWSLAAGWGCSYGTRQAQELASVHRASPFHAHLLLRFQA